MKRFFSYISLLAISWNWIGCISEYDPGIEGISNILVVEGIITNGTTEIKLSRSVQLSESITDAPVVENAEVSVEAYDGTVFPTLSSSSGSYYIEMGELDADRLYRLKIELDGQSYVSEYLAPLETPPIQEIAFYKKEKGSSIQTRLTTVGTDENSRYYLWSFNEIWEIKAPIMATVWEEYPEAPIIEYDPYSPYYYCWKYNQSKSILLGSSYKLTENKILDRLLMENAPDNDRYSFAYYLKVRQNSLRKEAYDYLNTLRTNAEETGSIFGAVPSEMRGNIECTTDSSIPVIGYVEVSSTQYDEQFYNSSAFAGLYEAPVLVCPVFSSLADIAESGYSRTDVTLFEINPQNSYAPWNCVDCRRFGGGKLKPEWWPNDHI